MIVKPKIRGFICTTAHPTGCEKNVQNQINYVKKNSKIEGPKKVLVIGSSQGFGLSSRIVSTFGAGADTIGVYFEKPATETKTGSAGWYNNIAFENEAKQAGYYAKSFNGDAFSDEIKNETIDLIKKDFGKIDLVVYSLAAPKRVDPKTGEVYSSVIKPTTDAYTNKTVNTQKGIVSEITVDPAIEEEVEQTIKVMGGEDWKLWIDALENAGVLAEGFTTVAYNYIGPEVTHAIYKNGTIGRAKEHLDQTAYQLSEQLKKIDGRAIVSVNKALVTQSSSAIPVVPLYISILYKVMKEKGLHEGCIEQMYRLYDEHLYTSSPKPLDENGRIRIDDWEMKKEVQDAVASLWKDINTENLEQLTDIEGYRKEFLQIFGFEFDGVDYEADVDPILPEK
ncbi:enoyl-ACP reductase FabV [Chengkuizengella axinellae]|uniref:Trans-2-enoyl-CoA reductase [NADH] n=1 Tax=Chengkuizengella axinellae TaxID=3064388 RepID=A0ABT9J5F1_9BACL|nr:enoyl-ACP reductase FabV [Chengkuizengella sp. 2205SS18-9]MDP5276850.1 trans-2-enoyl-CoA reductase family protein [Chengkuizengella sp. 2205SS18-9]